jgi:hypothetical protein
MTVREPDEQRRRQYLLGALPEEDAVRLEREFLADDAAYEDLVALEDDLFHDYARGGLTDGERVQFERRFLRESEGRRRLADARRVQAALQAPSARPGKAVQPSSAPWLAAAAALLLASAAAWWAWAPDGPPIALGPTPGPAASPSPPAAVSPSPTRAPVITVLALVPGLTRGASGPRRALLPADASVLRLVLELPPGRPPGPYRVVARSAEGAEVWSGEGAAASGDTVAVDVPASALAEGDYELVLSALSPGGARRDLADYAFGVLRP